MIKTNTNATNQEQRNERQTQYDINELARKAAAGTLKRIHNASANDNIRKLRDNLQADFNALDNNLIDTDTSLTLSDAYDVYMVAYDYLYDMIIVKGYTPDDTMTIKLKNGNDKTRTVYQWACVMVRQYVYSQASNEIYTSTKTVKKADGTKVKYKTIGYTYIEDLSTNSDDTGIEALDREYIRMGKYNGIDTYNDYITYTEILTTLNLTERQLSIVKLRMQGLNVGNIADKLGVARQTITTQLSRIQAQVINLYPDMIKAFDLAHK